MRKKWKDNIGFEQSVNIGKTITNPGGRFLLLSEGLDDPEAAVYATEDCSSIRVFFRPKKYVVCRSVLMNKLNILISTGRCVYYNLDKLTSGEVEVHFNPACHHETDRQIAFEKIVEILKSSRACLIDGNEAT